MPMTKDQVRELIYARLVQLTNSPDDDISIKAIHELGVIAGLHADVNPKAITAMQTNNFTIPAEKLTEALSAIRRISGGGADANVQS